jgi:hypothetical protein
MTGPLQAHTSIMCGQVTLIMSDSEGNIKEVRRNHNVISSLGKRAMADACFQGSAGHRAIYAYVLSGAATAPSLSMTLACSGGMPSLNAFILARQPKTLTYGWNTDAGWSVNGSMTFTNGPVSINAVALCFSPATAPAASISLTDWFAAVQFTAWAPASQNMLTITWNFSISSTASTAP